VEATGALAKTKRERIRKSAIKGNVEICKGVFLEMEEAERPVG